MRWQRQALKVARELDRKIDFDVVHHVSFGSLHLGSPLWRLDKPFVFGPVGGGQIAPRGFRRYLRGGWLTELLRSFVVRYFTGILFAARSTVANADLVLVVNEETREWANRLGGRHVKYMATGGIPESLISASPSKRRRGGPLRILWVGRLLPRKAVLLALEALKQISSEVEFRCTILGDGKQGRYLAGWIEDLDLNDRVDWRGQVSWAEAMEAYRRHDVFLFTTLRETEGLQLLEAMAGGAAVVTLDHHGPRMVVPTGAGIKVPVTTPEKTVAGLARALERLAREPDTVNAMGLAGVKWAAENTWEKKAASAGALYPDVIARHSRRDSSRFPKKQL
jgi:glycosyltransferase involved in cell wall biosynthesis